ncbi:uncharacterized protein TRAVEDRAFT_49188 [Trametes versicolor FP-101664 SS1]|uniref:uncharacterized protein n=1 Tax=Trametes versicolor (strain FP-101664) TaxID=717944 RepID=UPI00046234CD|nr:uncharacterized protein TRAVEDRAFT_49188 [Trametes versicolor FP-101664 SS1]EIW56358.1 hypothetical protein TRAVEDRAFT_49188 [Trametes versicolor FP-101664 SS1]
MHSQDDDLFGADGCLANASLQKNGATFSTLSHLRTHDLQGSPLYTFEGTYISDNSLSPETPTASSRYSSSSLLMPSRLADPPGLGDSFSASTSLQETGPMFRNMHPSGAEYTRSLRHAEILSAKLRELEKVNAELTATVRTLQHAYKVLATAQPRMLATSGNPFNLAVTPDAGWDVKSLLACEDAPIIKFNSEKHANLKFFSRKHFKPYMKGQPKHDLATKQMEIGKSGRTRGVPIFLESLDGTIMAADRYSDLRAHCRNVLQTLDDTDNAPEVWSKINDAALNYVIVQVGKVFPEVQECENHWKLKHLMMNMYSDFGRDRSNTAPKKDATAKKAASKKRPLPDGDANSAAPDPKRQATTPGSQTPSEVPSPLAC